ncbi:MAG: hypothetical protein IGS39_15460 [Calothrix sp. C42_A2020_038]|nr:hypothetical protein [Calothrix sp. C42_A2020_038]
MSRLKIVDLSFLETELSQSGEVQGGISTFYQPVGSVSTSFDAAFNASYFGNWSVYQIGRGYVVEASIYGSASGASAGATAGATSDGTHFATSYARSTSY